MKFKFRAVSVTGFTHGGGGCELGTCRDSYEEAAKDMSSERFKSAYGDSISVVETVPADKAF